MRIIDNKKIDLTNDEWIMYQEICKSYDTHNQQGKDLFVGLFITDDDGIITALVPPSTRYTSLEVYLYLASVMIQQHLRIMHRQTDEMCGKVDAKLKELESKSK